MLKVLSILEGNRAIIDTAGLCRLVDSRDGEVIDELLSPMQGEAAQRGYNGRGNDGPGVLIPYSELANN